MRLLALVSFAVLSGIKPGSVRVKAGQRVARGAVLGLCGNSGNSSEPHLHFHLQQTAVLQDGLGIRCFFGPWLSTGQESARRRRITLRSAATS